MSDYERRFYGISRLYGARRLADFQAARIAVVGLGGVGSWTVEALARSGIGTLILVDFDEACVSNINRQLHALSSTVGKAKVDILAERCLEINPEIQLVKRIQFFTPSTSDAFFALKPAVVVDAIDDRSNKVYLIAQCHQRAIPLVTCGGAGGRLDPSLIEVKDLAQTVDDRLLASVRKQLRAEHGFPREPRRKWGIPSVFSTEPHTFAQPDGSVSSTREKQSGMTINCENGLGSSTPVTGTFGFMMAAEALKRCPVALSAQEESVEVLKDGHEDSLIA